MARAAASSSAYDSYDSYAADNFYQILGVPESASRRDIKRAYKAMMRDFHPDLSGDEESTEFCVLLNDIYEVGGGRRGVRVLLLCAMPAGDQTAADLLPPCNTLLYYTLPQTLMDPERRATYDALAGFSAGSINPFADVSLPADQVCCPSLQGTAESSMETQM